MRALLGLALVLAACTPPQGPAKTLDHYSRSLKNHDFAAAYDLMSSSFRAKVSREEYVRMMRDNPREVDETAQRLNGKHGSMEVSAEFEYGLGDTMRLVNEGGTWKIASNPLAFYDQSSARSIATGRRCATRTTSPPTS